MGWTFFTGVYRCHVQHGQCKEGIGFWVLVEIGGVMFGSSALVVSFVNSLSVLVEYLIYLLYYFGSSSKCGCNFFETEVCSYTLAWSVILAFVDFVFGYRRGGE